MDIFMCVTLRYVLCHVMHYLGFVVDFSPWDLKSNIYNT